MIPLPLLVSGVVAMGLAYLLRRAMHGPAEPITRKTTPPAANQFDEFLRRVRGAIVPGARKP